MNGVPVSRKRIVSRAWLFSTALHGALLAALSLCYVTRATLHEQSETTEVDVTLLREPTDVPPQPLAEMREDNAPPQAPNWVLRAQEPIDEAEPVVVTALEDEPTAAVVPPEPSREAPPSDSTAVQFDTTPVLKRILTRQHAAGDGGGGSQQGSGGAPAIPTSSTGTVAAGRGGSGSGSGTGIGNGGGSGNRAGLGSAASGNGAGNGHGDGIGSGTGGRGGAIASKPARVRRIASASYPRDAQRAGYEGLVKVRIQVLPTGAIDGVEVVQSSGYDSLDSAACSAAKQCNIEPQEEDGKPIACSFTIPYRFTLHGR